MKGPAPKEPLGIIFKRVLVIASSLLSIQLIFTEHLPTRWQAL